MKISQFCKYNTYYIMKYKQITKEIILHGLKPAKIGGRNRPSKTGYWSYQAQKKRKENKEQKVKDRNTVIQPIIHVTGVP